MYYFNFHDPSMPHELFVYHLAYANTISHSSNENQVQGQQLNATTTKAAAELEVGEVEPHRILIS